MKIYLCGGIHGLSDKEANEWRERAKKLLNDADVLDPMRRDYRKIKTTNLDSFIESDLRDVMESDVLLVNAKRPSWGTAMEIVYAKILHRRVVAFVDSGEQVSPWLRYHCDTIANSLEEAVASIGER